MVGKITDRTRTVWQGCHIGRHIILQGRHIQIKMPRDAMNIAVRQIHDLMQPMHQLHIRIATQFTKYRSTLNCLKQSRVQLPKQRRS